MTLNFLRKEIYYTSASLIEILKYLNLGGADYTGYKLRVFHNLGVIKYQTGLLAVIKSPELIVRCGNI